MTAAAHASRNIAGVRSPSHKDKPSSTSGGAITPIVSAQRLAFVFAASRGRPSAMPKATRVRPKNASRRQPRNIAVAKPCPEATAARTTCNSLKKGPKGGQAVTANIPAIKIAAERGVSTDMPRALSIEAAPAVADLLASELPRCDAWKADALRSFQEPAKGYLYEE